MDLKGRNFLTLRDYTPEEITYLLDLAADLIVKSQVCNTGQTCIGYNRIYVHEKRYEEFCQKVLDRLKKVTIGAGRDDGEMVMGPMISFRERYWI